MSTAVTGSIPLYQIVPVDKGTPLDKGTHKAVTSCVPGSTAVTGEHTEL